MSDGWLIGWAIGGVVVVLVVLLLSILIASTRRIARQAARIRRSLEALEGNTAPLWDVAAVNVSLRSMTTRLRQEARLPPSEEAQEDRW